MAIKSRRCHVARADVSVITDLEERVVRVICPDYGPSGDCRLKQRALGGGLLSQLLERVAEDTLDSRSMCCDLRA
jgi:hypothetical protein